MNRKLSLAIVVIMSILVTSVVLAQSDPVDTTITECTEAYELWRDSRLVASCSIEDDIVTIVDSTGTIQRPATVRESAINSEVRAFEACMAETAAAKNLISTPIARGDLAEVNARLNAVETILLNEDKC